MNSTKLSAFCDKLLEMGWLLAVIITPLLFNVYSSRVFEPDKLTTLRTIAVVMAAIWVVQFIEERVSGQYEIGVSWRTPLVLPTLFTVIAYLLSTVLSVTHSVSLWGSYQRLQGTYTTLAYIVVFLIILQKLRTRAQLDRMITVIIINSLPIALYGLVQHNRLDPLPWGGDVTRRVASNMGNPIFVAAYLIMIFPLIVGRIGKTFKAILTEENSDWADIPRAAGYIFIAAVDVIAIWYAHSRGPLLGLIAGSYFLFLLLALSSRTRWGAASALAIITVTTLVVGFLVVVNIPGGPLQSLQQAPWLGRLGEVFDFEGGTGKVRALIWQGMVDMILPHEPLQYPDGQPDPFNALRPLVGYGPESIYVAYNRFYPPLLGHYESRTSSPDRSHNETLDSLAITGLLGLVAYLWVFCSVFYYGLKWLGLVEDRRQRNLLFGLVAGLSVCSVAFFWWWQGLHFFGAALTLGIVSGLGIYLALVGAIAAIRLLTSNESTRSPRVSPPHYFLLISIFAATVAHFVEINFGIAIAATRTTFWAYAGLFVVAGLNLIRASEKEPTRQKSRSQRRRRRKRTRSSAGSMHITWLGPTLAISIVGGFILGTLAFDFVTNAERLAEPLNIVWRALTVLPAQESRTSYGALMIFTLTWLMSAVVFISEMAKQGTFSERPGDGSLATTLYLLISLTVGFGLALVLANRQASMMFIQTPTMEDVIGIADRVASLLTIYYGFIVFVLVAGAGALLLGTRRLPLQVAQPWGTIALIVLTVLTGAVAIATNLQPIQADIVYKQADPYDRQGQWRVAIEHYKHAIELAPKEDFYYLYLGRAYLEYASSLQDPAVQNTILRETEQTLMDAREINPLNTDHSANLARMYRRWADSAQDDETRALLLQRSSEEYATATSLSPHNAILWNEWAILMYYGLGDIAGYERILQHSLEIDPEFAQTWLICGDVNRGLGNMEEAIHCYEEALRIEPKAPQVWRALGETYRAMQRWEDAIAAFNEALELKPKAVDVWRALGDTYIAVQQWEQAIAALTRALELQPEAGDIWNVHQVLAQLYGQIGQQEQALAHASTALQLAPEDQQAMLQDLVAQLEQLEASQP